MPQKRYPKNSNFNKNLASLIVVKTSNIPQAGNGAFAKTIIPKGTRIGEYNGKLLSLLEYEALEDKSYVFEVAKKYQNRYYLFYIDAMRGDDLRYVNGAYGEDQSSQINVESYQYAERIFFRATRTILPGEELLIDYGDNYWE